MSDAEQIQYSYNNDDVQRNNAKEQLRDDAVVKMRIKALDVDSKTPGSFNKEGLLAKLPVLKVRFDFLDENDNPIYGLPRFSDNATVYAPVMPPNVEEGEREAVKKAVYGWVSSFFKDFYAAFAPEYAVPEVFPRGELATVVIDGEKQQMGVVEAKELQDKAQEARMGHITSLLNSEEARAEMVGREAYATIKSSNGFTSPKYWRSELKEHEALTPRDDLIVHVTLDGTVLEDLGGASEGAAEETTGRRRRRS